MILSLDTSGPLFSIAVLSNNLIKQKSFEANKANSEKMIIEIHIFLKNLQLSLDDINGIAFGAGPGSFSGVRVACGIAYGIAFAKKIPINGVNILKALAALNPDRNTISCIDARMNQIYLGAFEFKDNKINSIDNEGVYDPDNLPILHVKKPIIIGSGLKSFSNEMRVKYDYLAPTYDEKNYALAGEIAKLSQNDFKHEFDLSNAAPIYLRNKVANTIIERQKSK